MLAVAAVYWPLVLKTSLISDVLTPMAADRPILATPTRALHVMILRGVVLLLVVVADYSQLNLIGINTILPSCILRKMEICVMNLACVVCESLYCFVLIYQRRFLIPHHL